MQRLSFLLALFCIVSFPLRGFADELNAGFVEGLWYGSKIVIANEPTRIYVALRNNTDHDLTGTVRFTDNGTRIGISYVSALPGRIVEAWVDWKPQYGEHAITASLSDIRVHAIGESPETGEVENTIAQDTVFVDYDTDSDGIPNQSDTDDDNDTVSDADENARGTDPLKANPIQKEESSDASKPTDTEKNTHEPRETSSPKPTTSNTSRDGLENYVPNPTVRTIIESVTDTINETKTSLDDYRNERRSTAITPLNSTTTRVLQSTFGTSTSDTATITRSRPSEKSFFTNVLQSGKSIVSGLFTLLFALLSEILSHPALLELALLIVIIYITYRTARRFGRRKKN